MAGSKYQAWLVSAMPSIPLVPPHLSHRHPLRWPALQENLLVQGHFLAQRLLIEVLAQVWEKEEGSPGTMRWNRSLKRPALATRWECTPRERARPGAFPCHQSGASPGGAGGTGFPP